MNLRLQHSTTEHDAASQDIVFRRFEGPQCRHLHSASHRTWTHTDRPPPVHTKSYSSSESLLNCHLNHEMGHALGPRTCSWSFHLRLDRPMCSRPLYWYWTANIGGPFVSGEPTSCSDVICCVLSACFRYTVTDCTISTETLRALLTF